MPRSNSAPSLVAHSLWEAGDALRVESLGLRAPAALRLERSPCGRGRLLWAGEPRVWFRTIEGSYALAWWIAPGRPARRFHLDARPLRDGESWPRRVLEALRDEQAPSPWRGGSSHVVQYVPSLPITHAHHDLVELARYATDAEIAWSRAASALVPTRLVSRADDARVRWYRKLARRVALPPVFTLGWRAAGLEIVIDGHDRWLASLLEGRCPALVSVTEVRRRRSLEDDVATFGAQAEALLATRVATPHGERVRDETASRVAFLPWSTAAYRCATSASPLSISADVWDREIRFLARSEHRPIPADLLRP